MIPNNAFVHRFSTFNQKYLYDVNKDTIIGISDDEYDFFGKNKEFNLLKEDDQNHLSVLEEKGYFSNKRVKELKHTMSDEVEKLLYNQAQRLTLQVTQACNLVCEYCPYANVTEHSLQRNHSKKKMTWEIAKKAIDSYYEYSKDEDHALFGFYGGEPLLAFDLIKKCVEYIKEEFFGKNIIFSMTTNGTVFTDEMLEFLVENRFSLTFSIDGPKEIHDLHRKKADGSGSFDNVISSLKKIIDAVDEDIVVEVNMVFYPDRKIDEIFKLFDDPVFERKNIKISYSLAEDDLLEKKIEVKEDYHSTFLYQLFLCYLSELNIVDNIKISPALKATALTLKNEYERFKAKTDKLPDMAVPSGPCVPGKQRLFVSAEGNYYPCEKVSELSECMKIGSVDEGYDIEKIRNLMNFSSITENLCRNCYAFLHCDICAMYADDNGVLSAEKKKAFCEIAKSTFDQNLKAAVLIREYKNTYSRMEALK